jgi:hypothetical protein
MSVMGISVLTPVVHLLLEQFKNVPYHDYLGEGDAARLEYFIRDNAGNLIEFVEEPKPLPGCAAL